MPSSQPVVSSVVPVETRDPLCGGADPTLATIVEPFNPSRQVDTFAASVHLLSQSGSMKPLRAEMYTCVMSLSKSSHDPNSLYFFEAAALALRTRLTMVASSIRKARVILSVEM